ncbi:MAG: MerR family transcriptional regulator [Acidimicrobiia bacterium]
MVEVSWRIDDLARRARVTVDTIRFYQREHLLPPAERSGRNKLYGPAHLLRLERIRELQKRRFSLAAIRALLDGDEPGIVEGIFASDGKPTLTFDDLVERSGVDLALADALRRVGVIRDPQEFGRNAYTSADLDVLVTIATLHRNGVPAEVLVDLGRIYATGVEQMQQQVVELMVGERGPQWEESELREFQRHMATSAGKVLPLVGRVVQYVHQRTLQRLTLRAIERYAPKE